MVSIHAPRAGRDIHGSHNSSNGACFNPRAPRGARPDRVGTLDEVLQFQSTRPARGATNRLRHFVRPWKVSIHAPRAGRDPMRIFSWSPEPCFNPRAPRGARHPLTMSSARLIMFQSTRPARGATGDAAAPSDSLGVSIHAPRAGRDNIYAAAGVMGVVSIHAPRAGRDVRPGCEVAAQECFNPRAPRGARRHLRGGHAHRRRFNPRAPRGARRSTPGALTAVRRFQSTRPARGATGTG